MGSLLGPISRRSLSICRWVYVAPDRVGGLHYYTGIFPPPLPPPYDDHHHYWKNCRRWHVGHSHDPGESEGVFKLGLAADVGLAAGKVITGYLSGSTAIIADAAHSVSDIVLSGLAWLSFRVGRAPKDKEHPYGHGKFETLGALGISGMLLATAGGIAWHAVDVMQEVLTSGSYISSHVMLSNHDHGGHHHGIDMNHPILALNMTIISIAVKEGLYWITKKAGDKDGSGLMKANAWHHRADAISSVVALIGVGGSILGMHVLDPLAGLVVSGMIMKAGVESGYQSIMELVDAGVAQHVLAPIMTTILQVEGVRGCHHLRGRRAGSSLYLDVHIEVDPFSSVSAVHNIGELVRCQLQKSHREVAEVFIHIDPAVSRVSHAISSLQQNVKEGRDQILSSNEQAKVEAVAGILLEKFSQRMTVEHITYHSLQGRILVQVQVSMPPNILIMDAMEIAKEAEEEILKAAPNIARVGIQLNLGNPIPCVHDEMSVTHLPGGHGSECSSSRQALGKVLNGVFDIVYSN